MILQEELHTKRIRHIIFVLIHVLLIASYIAMVEYYKYNDEDNMLSSLILGGAFYCIVFTYGICLINYRSKRSELSTYFSWYFVGFIMYLYSISGLLYLMNRNNSKDTQVYKSFIIFSITSSFLLLVGIFIKLLTYLAFKCWRKEKNPYGTLSERTVVI